MKKQLIYTTQSVFLLLFLFVALVLHGCHPNPKIGEQYKPVEGEYEPLEGRDEVKEDKKAQQAIKETKEIEALLKEIEGKDYRKLDSNKEIKKYRQIAGQALYLALKGNHPAYSERLMREKGRINLVGHALSLAINDSDCVLQAVLERLDKARPQRDPYTMIDYISRGLLQAIIEENGEALKTWKQALTKLYAAQPEIEYHSFDKSLKGLLLFIVDHSHLPMCQEYFELLASSIALSSQLLSEIQAPLKKKYQEAQGEFDAKQIKAFQKKIEKHRRSSAYAEA